LTGALTYEKALSDGGSPVLDQLALADVIERGELDRHLRRMRLRYRSRREALVDALAAELPAAEPVGVPAGTHTLVILEDGADEAALARAAAARGVGVAGLAAHYAGERPGRPTGLVLGYGSLPEPAIRRGVALLAEAAREAGA
jgi:GntR family transcriptional regulator/MocR family aminotransferase